MVVGNPLKKRKCNLSTHFQLKTTNTHYDTLKIVGCNEFVEKLYFKWSNGNTVTHTCPYIREREGVLLQGVLLQLARKGKFCTISKDTKVEGSNPALGKTINIFIFSILFYFYNNRCHVSAFLWNACFTCRTYFLLTFWVWEFLHCVIIVLFKVNYTDYYLMIKMG